MSIRKIRALNFKTFKDLEVELGNFSVLIGANAAGKSNFIQIFQFLRDIQRFGLDNAVSMQGGVEYLRNINLGSSTNCSMQVTSSWNRDWFGIRETKANIYETNFEFSLKFGPKGPGFEIAEDKITYKCDFFRSERRGKSLEKLGSGEIIVSRKDQWMDLKLNLPEAVSKDGRQTISQALILDEQQLPDRSLFLERPYRLLPVTGRLLEEIAIYDFDPKLPKKAIPFTGKAELEEDGSNLAIVLKNIMEDKEKERRFSNLVRDLLPFVDKLGVERFADKSLLFNLRETYSETQYLPASLISDGTINITALIIALYFEKKNLVIIEEPERNLHPYLVSKVVNMMKDASQQKQIIATTHNPEVVKHVELNDILLIFRDKEGFSSISRLSEKAEIKTFLENEMGVEDLYVQNLLEIQP